MTMDFPSSLLDVPQVQHNPRIYQAVEAEAERALGRLLGGKQHSEMLRQHLFDAFPGSPDMTQVARQLGMAARSLRRRLSEEGTSFQQLVVEARVARATRLLEDPRRSIKDTAYAMGFASPSAFHRAFKRWTGVSPSAVRGGGLARS
jgi:AraC-like DNA-binding protein